MLAEGADHIGEVQAWNVDTGKRVWTHTFATSANWGPMLATGGGLVFSGGTNDRKFRAFDAATGAVRWEFVTNSGVIGQPSSFSVNGRQYIAVQSGWGIDARAMQNRLIKLMPGIAGGAGRRRDLGVRAALTRAACHGRRPEWCTLARRPGRTPLRLHDVGQCHPPTGTRIEPSDITIGGHADSWATGRKGQRHTYDQIRALPHPSWRRDRRGDRAARTCCGTGPRAKRPARDRERPRQSARLEFGPDGALYVAEAGRGGTSTLCAPAPDPPFANRCYGPTGAITRILAAGDQRRVVVGLPSIAPAGGNTAQGPVDIDFGMGAAWVTTGFGGNPANRAPLEAGGVQMGRLVKINSIGQWESVVDLSAHEAANNPDGTTVDSNPFGLRVLDDRAYVADAGANAVLQISKTGAISTFAVFPARQPNPAPPSVQAVPTSVAVAPNGDVYVGELTGAPFFVGAARVYRIPAGGGTPVVVATGFTNIIDIALGPDGAGYVLEHDANGIITPGDDGRLIRLNTQRHANRAREHRTGQAGRRGDRTGRRRLRDAARELCRNWPSGSHSAVVQTAQAAGVASDLLATLQRPRAA